MGSKAIVHVRDTLVRDIRGVINSAAINSHDYPKGAQVLETEDRTLSGDPDTV